MKIGVVYQSNYPPKTGASGADRRVRDITRGLSQEGNKIHMLVPSNRNTGVQNMDTADYEIKYIEAKGGNVMLSRYRFWTNLTKHVKDSKLDAILLYNSTAESVFFVNGFNKLGVKVIYEICDLHSSFGLSLKNILVKFAEIRLPRLTKLNIVISELLKNKVKKAAPKTPILKIPILVDSDLFITSEKLGNQFRNSYGIENDEFIITYVGGHWKHEGVKFLVEAFAKLVEKYSNIHLVVAGKLAKSDVHDDIATLVKELKLEGRTTLTGWVGTDEVLKLFSASNVLTVPQTNHTFSQAGLPTKLAEYSSMGKSIVATDVGDVGEYFQTGINAILCKHSDSESLAQALERLINDEELCKKISKGAKIVAEQYFDYRVNGTKMLEAINSI